MISSKSTGQPFLLKALGFFGLLLLLSSCILTIYSLEAGIWLSFTNLSGDYKLSLLRCEECPRVYKDWSADCFSVVGCDADSGSTLCSRWTLIDSADTALYYMHYFAVLCSILLIERVLFRLLNRYVGMNLLSYILAALTSVLQIIGIGQWFALTKAKLSDTCDNEGDELNVCAEQGAILNLSATCAGFIGCGIVALYMKLSGSQEGTLFKIEGRRTFLLTKVFPVLLISLFFDVFSLNWRWTYYENTQKHHNFLTFADKYKGYDNYGHNCISSTTCEAEYKITSTKRECKAFDRLFDAGEYLRKFKLAEFVFAALWLEGMSFCCTFKEFGIPFLQYSWPLLMLLSQIIALVGWAAISGSAFTNNCQVLSLDTDIDFCSDTSVIFTILGIIINFIAIVSFMIVYINRYDFKVKVAIYDEKTLSDAKLPKKLKDDFNDTSLNHSISMNSSILDNSTLANESRSATPNLRERSAPSILSEMKPLSKRGKKSDLNCTLCHKR